MSRRVQAAWLLLSLLLCLALTGMANIPYVDDQAEVLPLQLTEDITAYSARMAQGPGVPFYLVTKHFLGGRNVQQYAQQALEALGDGRAVLLVVVIGEENYALAIGEQSRQLLSDERAESMLDRAFRQPFLVERDYSKAIAAFLLDLSAYLQSRTEEGIREEGSLPVWAGRAQRATPQETAHPTSGPSWLDGILEDRGRREVEAQEYAQDVQEAQEGSDRGLSLFQIALIGFILFKIFGRDKTGRGKGCGPLGWIFGTWGVSKIFRWRR